MIFIRVKEETETKAKVELIHYEPDQLSDKEKAEGFLVNNVPDPIPQGKKVAILYFNPQSKDFWYEYVDAQLPEEDRIAKLEIATEENKKANLDTQEAVLQLYEMVTGPQA